MSLVRVDCHLHTVASGDAVTTLDQLAERAAQESLDVLFITDIYAASEDPIEGVTAEALTAAIKSFGHKDVNYVGALENAAPALVDRIQPGDLVLTLGAGTVNRISDQVLQLLRGQSSETSV